MAGTQQNNPRNSMFPPSLFDDPDTISQIAQAEIPQAPQQTPGDQANVPMTGVVPPTFLDWHADPANVAKIAPPIPKNTPMPSVVAAKVQSAFQPTSDDTIPPLSPDIQGSPEAQLYGTPTPQVPPVSDTTAPAQASAPGPGLMNKVQPAASLDAALMSGAAPQTAASPAASAQPASPLSKPDWLAQNPVAIPKAPYVPQGKKLALTGLFAALDNIGASLDHGTQTVGPGLMRNVQALQEYNQNLPATQHEAEESGYQNYLKNYGTIRQNTLVPLTTIGPNGQTITTMVDPKTQQAAIGAGVKAGGTVQAAQIGAQSRLDVKNVELAVQQGQISKMVPGINPANNQPQYEAFNKAGQSLGFIDHSVVPGLIARTSSTVEYKEDGDGNLHALPKTTVSAPSLPGSTARVPMTPPKPSTVPASAQPISTTGTPSSVGSPVTAPATSSNPSTPPKPAAGGSIVPGFLGKSAKETGTAYDPKTDSYYVTTRSDANQNGYQNFTKSTAAQQDADRQMNNRITDVQQKMDRYQGTFAHDLSDSDKTNLAALTSDNDFKVGAFGTELPTGWLKKIVSTNAYQALSPDAQSRFLAYANARESMSGYQRVLTGSSRGNEKTLQLQLDTLADPTWTPQAAGGAFNQFNENLRIAGQGLPKMPGVQNATDLHKNNQPGAANGVPAGAKVRDYTQLGK